MKKFALKKFVQFIFFSSFLLSFSYRNAQASDFDSIAREVDKTTILQGKHSSTLIHRLYEIARSSSDSLHLLPKCLYRESVWTYEQGVQNTELKTIINNYLDLHGKDTDSQEEALLHYSLALNYVAEGSYADAFSSALQSLQLFEKFPDSLFIAKSLNLLGTICYNVNLLPTSYDYHNQAKALLSPGSAEYYRTCCNIYRNYIIEGDPNRCRDSLLNIIPNLEYLRDTNLLVVSYINMAASYSHLSDFETAFQYCNKVEKLIENIDNKKFLIVLYQNYALYYYQQSNFLKARDYFKLAAKIGEKNNILPYLSTAYGNLSYTYEALQQIDSAYFYLQKFQELQDKEGDGAKAIAAYHTYISTFLESSENKLVIAEQKVVLRNRQLQLFIILAIASILAVALFLIVAQQKRRLKENENKELALQLEHEKEIKEIQEEKHLDDIASKMREITSYSLQLSNKNNLLQEISGLVGQLTKKEKNTDEIVKKLHSIVKNNLNTDHEIEAFKQHFEKVHPRFFDKLKFINGSLTENNLRLCAYFRIGISPKQIAQILNISPESVSMNRHRLRKKLGLAEEESLEDFLRNI